MALRVWEECFGSRRHLPAVVADAPARDAAARGEKLKIHEALNSAACDLYEITERQ